MKNILLTLLLALGTALLCFTCKNESASKWKHSDNTVRVRIVADVKSMNPYLSSGSWGSLVQSLVFQYPLDFDPATLQLAPQLAKAAAVVNDIQGGELDGGRSFTFEIMPEAVWDDGKPVTGYDYEFTLKTVFNPKLPEIQRYASYLESVRDIEVDATNPKLFTIFTKDKYFLSEAAFSNIAVLPAHIYDAEGLLKSFSLKDLTDPAKVAALANDPKLQQQADAFKSPKFAREVIAGSGPYSVVDWVDGQRIVLAKKKNWWGDKLAGQFTMLAAYPDTVIFMPIPDQTAAATAVKDESVDVALEMDSKQFRDLEQNKLVTDVYNLQTPPRFAIFYIAMQNQNPKLSDKRVRRALALVTDMDAVIRDLYEGFGERVVGPFLQDKKYYASDLKLLAMNLDEARKLLAEAGWKDSNGNGTVDKVIDGKSVEMKLQFLYLPQSTFQANYTELFKNNAQKVGIEVERVAVESNVMLDHLKSGDYELAGKGGGSAPVPDDPKQLWHTESARAGGSNYARFGNAQSDALIDAIRNAPDEAKRNELYRQFQQLIYDEQPVIFQFAPKDKIAIHKRFANPIVSRKSPGVSLQHLKLKE